MNPSELLIWGIVLHLVADWLLQNEWMAANKANLRRPAGYVHAGIHGAVQLLIFPWWAAALIAVTHLLIDTRKPIIWWSKLIRQTQPKPAMNCYIDMRKFDPNHGPLSIPMPGFDFGAEVRIWADQVAHIGVVALIALGAGA